MGTIKELKCPNCGSNVHPAEGQRILSCPNCFSSLEYDDGSLRIYHETRHIDEAEILKQKVELEKIRNQKQQANQQLKNTAIRAIGPVVIVLLIILFFSMRVRAGYQSDYRGMDYMEAKNRLSTIGFWNITCIPVEDIGAKSAYKDGTVSEVLINGKDNLYKISYKWDKVEIYYHKMPENPPVEAPKDSGGNYSGWKLQDAVNDLYKAGFAEVYSRVENDLDSVSDGRMGKVYNVTIAGETDWTNNNSRKKYYRNDEVVVYYHDATPTAQASPPEGNASLLIGHDYNVVKARFEEAGFTNIQIQSSNVAGSGITQDEVISITVNGDTNWSYGIGGMLRSTYKRNVLVIITYYSSK